MSRYYVYRKMVRLEELGADGKPEGRAELTTNPVVTGDGARSPGRQASRNPHLES